MKWFLISLFVFLPVTALAQGGGAGVEVEPDLVDLALPYVDLALAVLGGLVVAASAIAAFTKSTEDDAAVGIVKRLLDRLSVLKDRVK